jgi:hypothetical protein
MDADCAGKFRSALLEELDVPLPSGKHIPVVRAGWYGDGDCAKLFRNGSDLHGVVAGYQSEMQGSAGWIDAGRCTVEIEGKPPTAGGSAGDRFGQRQRPVGRRSFSKQIKGAFRRNDFNDNPWMGLPGLPPYGGNAQRRGLADASRLGRTRLSCSEP